jgi:hypothetical protein
VIQDEWLLYPTMHFVCVYVNFVQSVFLASENYTSFLFTEVNTVFAEYRSEYFFPIFTYALDASDLERVYDSCYLYLAG